MKLTVVGCAPAYTSERPGWTSSCYLVELGEAAVLLDLGQGSFAELCRYRPPETLRAVLVSHLHADHLIDLIPLRHYLRYGAAGKEVALHGPPELEQRIDALQGEPGFLAPLRFQPLREGAVAVAGVSAEARRVTHIPDSFAFRLAPPDGGRGLVYSGDCSEAGDLVSLIQRGDTLLCEAAFGTDEDAKGAHLTARQAAWAAATGGAGKLVLTHVLDEHADQDALVRAAHDEFGGEVLFARPGLQVPVS